MSTKFISTAIPYVNAPPHIGFALELVIADSVARHARLRGEDVFFLSGTDDNSLKNALAAEEAGLPTAELVALRARDFQRLKPLLDVGYDDFLRTSADPRHAPAVERLWRACEASGDVYEDRYEGLYCVGCEQFYAEAELAGGLCPEHGVRPERVGERNYFFRLGRYRDALISLIESERLAIRPRERRNEVLAFLDAPLRDLSISRSFERAKGWGIPVPGDPSQVVYVWFDALANYVSALGYGGDDSPLRKYWSDDGRITHVIGKGVVRFHAVYWPAILLSAGLPTPTELLVHGYVTIEGEKISKSGGRTISPEDACARYGADALRYYLLRHIGSHRDGDFSWSRFAEVYEHELANDLGNLVLRTIALGRRHGVPERLEPGLAAGLAEEVERHVEAFALHKALDAICDVIGATNAYVNRVEPWRLAKDGRTDELEDVLGELYATLRSVADALSPFLPRTARRIHEALEASSRVPLFPREPAVDSAARGD